MKKNKIELTMQKILADYVPKSRIKEMWEEYLALKQFDKTMSEIREKIDQSRTEFRTDIDEFSQRFNSEIKKNRQEMEKMRIDMMTEIIESSNQGQRNAGALSEEFQHRLAAVVELTIGNTEDIIKMKQLLKLV